MTLEGLGLPIFAAGVMSQQENGELTLVGPCISYRQSYVTRLGKTVLMGTLLTLE